MWGQPMFVKPDAVAVAFQVNECRNQHRRQCIRVIAVDALSGWQAIRIRLVVNCPATESGIRLVRQKREDRVVRHTTGSDAMHEPEGARDA